MLISLYLELDDRPGLRIGGAPSGWGLALGHELPKPYDMAEYGRVEVGPVGELLGRAVGKVVTVWAVHTPDALSPVGVRWSTASGADVVIYAYDDELLVAPPDEVELGGAVTYSQIC